MNRSFRMRNPEGLKAKTKFLTVDSLAMVNEYWRIRGELGEKGCA